MVVRVQARAKEKLEKIKKTVCRNITSPLIKIILENLKRAFPVCPQKNKFRQQITRLFLVYRQLNSQNL